MKNANLTANPFEMSIAKKALRSRVTREKKCVTVPYFNCKYFKKGLLKSSLGKNGDPLCLLFSSDII